MLAALVGCGDRCEVLCQQTGARLAECKPASLSWSDLGARSRNDFVNECRRDWDRARLDLTASDLAVALEVCNDTVSTVNTMECDELTALYAPIP